MPHAKHKPGPAPAGWAHYHQPGCPGWHRVSQAPQPPQKRQPVCSHRCGTSPHRSSSDLLGGAHHHFHRPEEAPEPSHSCLTSKPGTQRCGQRASLKATCNTQRALLNLWVISLLNNEKEDNESAGTAVSWIHKSPTRGLRGLTSQMCTLIADRTLAVHAGVRSQKRCSSQCYLVGMCLSPTRSPSTPPSVLEGWGCSPFPDGSLSVQHPGRKYPVLHTVFQLQQNP